ncbi:MAG: response regulator transcription factor [Nitrospira sp.]|nr:response regulator transcription factor [Nitrospira sp.]MDH4304686.1 response regulator transcription factor [Nitrospira sp.]MDH5192896.1 response regulator transcription factor [Nitrospira sp.]
MIVMKHCSPIRTVLVDASVDCLVRLEKWLGMLSNFDIVGKASSGLEALERCEVLRPDLVIMDVVLPLMNGYEATVRMKEKGYCPTIILVSFFPIGEAYGKDDCSKADAILNKDALYEELIPAVTRLLSRQQPGKEVARRQ